MIKRIMLPLLMVLIYSVNVEAARQRTSIVDTNVFSEADVVKELEFGRVMAAQILGEYPLINDKELLRYINMVGQVILQYSSRNEINYYFGIIESDEINAYATPGGYIFITTAAFNLMQTEAELAAVLAHEIAHVSERHIVKELRIRANNDSAISTLGEIVSSSSSTPKALFDHAMNKAFELLYSKGLKVEDEYNSDRIGMLLLVMANYDPVSYFEYLSRIYPFIEKDNQQLNKTHPDIHIRIETIKTTFKNMGLLGASGYKNKHRFDKFKLQNY